MFNANKLIDKTLESLRRNKFINYNSLSDFDRLSNFHFLGSLFHMLYAEYLIDRCAIFELTFGFMISCRNKKQVKLLCVRLQCFFSLFCVYRFDKFWT